VDEWKPRHRLASIAIQADNYQSVSCLGNYKSYLLTLKYSIMARKTDEYVIHLESELKHMDEQYDIIKNAFNKCRRAYIAKQKELDELMIETSKKPTL